MRVQLGKMAAWIILLSLVIIQQQNSLEESEGVFRSVITHLAAVIQISFGFVGKWKLSSASNSNVASRK